MFKKAHLSHLKYKVLNTFDQAYTTEDGKLGDKPEFCNDLNKIWKDTAVKLGGFGPINTLMMS
jgi:hypothetical protein